jgi:aspartyl-tRNA(Asn)/glutamyl-tRNA(Gln) amidotransferase subunit A
MSDVLDLPIAQQAALVARGELSAVALTERALQRIEAKQNLHAFLHVAREAALAAASRVDQKRARGEPLGPLGGVPIAIKDALCTADAPTTCASKILTRRNAEGTAGSTRENGWRPPYDATVVARLRAADAVLVGKTNMDEFAMGSSGENSAFGPMRNPWDPTVRAAAARRRYRRAWPRAPSAVIPAVPFASQPPCAASLASNRRMGASPVTGSSPSHRASTK